MTGVSCRLRMSFAAVFAALAITLASTAARLGAAVAQVIFGWCSVNAGLLSLAYFLNWPGVFGKTERGTMQPLRALLMAPALVAIRMAWIFQNSLVRTPQYDEIAPNFFVGRLCPRSRLPDDISLVVDLTAEFSTPESIRSMIPTVCLPTLDGCPPDWEKCRQIIELIEIRPRRVYACCANGHGRSVAFAAAWLGYHGICHSADEALKHIQAARPSAALNRDQMSSLIAVFQFMRPRQLA